MGGAVGETGGGRPAASAVGGWPIGLILFFTLLHLINHVDRHLVASFAPHIVADLELSRSQFGLITGLAFSLVYAVMAVGSGLLADRLGRVRVLTAGVGSWSLFTAACGLATGFWSLLAMRPFVAAGEATLVPTASTIILGRTTEQRRATAIGIFFMGIPLGVGCSYLLAAWLGPMIGWRNGFFLMGGLGVLATLAVMRVRDVAPVAKGEAAPVRDQLARLRAAWQDNARYRNASIAVVLVHAHMATGAFTQLWLVADKGIAEARAASLYGLLFILFGSLGAAGSGALTDWLRRRFGMDHARSLAILLAVLAPLILAYRFAPAGSPLMLAGMVASILWFTAAYAPCFSVIEAELPTDLKATATGLNMLLINVLMLGGLAALIGLASDRLEMAHVAHSWTWPLVAADLLAMTAVLALLACGTGSGNKTR